MPDPVSGRKYEIRVSLPDDFSGFSFREWPVLVLADGPPAFQHLACRVRTLARTGQISVDPVVVALSYALGEDRENSRRRDYTPVPAAESTLVYGGAAPYAKYLQDIVLARVEEEFDTDPEARIFWGHSYGALLGTYIMLTRPATFQTWLFGSPSFWYEEGAIYAFEEAYAQQNRDLDARVFLYVGGLEVPRYDPDRKGYTRDMVAGVREFAARMQARKYAGLTVESTVLDGHNHQSAAFPGFEWAIRTAFPKSEDPQPAGPADNTRDFK